MTNDYTEALAQIDESMKIFFSLFDNRTKVPDLEPIYDLFIPEGRIMKCVSTEPEVYSVNEFAESRREILSGGQLRDFYEEELFSKTDIFGNIAQRISIYRKEGNMSGTHFSAYGIKTIQFVNTAGSYKIISAIWDDEREGFELDEEMKKHGFV